MKLLLDRKYKKSGYTIGKLYIDGKYFSDTLEDRDRGLTSDMTEETVKSKKVYGQTAIPTGTYELQMTYSPKFAARAWGKKYGGKVLEIPNVKGFSGVRLHPLNTAEDSLGCVGVGKNKKKGMILESTQTYYSLLDGYILPAINRREKIILTIK